MGGSPIIDVNLLEIPVVFKAENIFKLLKFQPDGQHHCHDVHQQGGRHQVPLSQADGWRDYSLVSGQGCPVTCSQCVG